MIAACDYKISPKCKLEYECSERAYNQNLDRNEGKYICLYCSRMLKASGRNNPNCKHKSLNDNFFEEVDCEGKAYLLGWIAAEGSITEGNISICIDKKDKEVLETLKYIICESLPINKRKHDTQVDLTINSKKIVSDVCKLLSVSPGAISYTIRLPKLKDDDLCWHFIRGYFEGDGSLNKPDNTVRPKISFYSSSVEMINDVYSFIGIKSYKNANSIVYESNNALDILNRMYRNANFYLTRKYNFYYDWSIWVPSLSGKGNNGNYPKFKWAKTDKDAIAPSKVRASDSGYDLSIIKKIKSIGNVDFYSTGIKVQPEYGWYFTLAPRSSIVKTGYILANSIGVIDRTYTGEIMVPLIKIDSNSPDIKLPSTIVQIIPCPIIHIDMEEDDLDDTERGSGGFGSTDSHPK